MAGWVTAECGCSQRGQKVIEKMLEGRSAVGLGCHGELCRTLRSGELLCVSSMGLSTHGWAPGGPVPTPSSNSCVGLTQVLVCSRVQRLHPSPASDQSAPAPSRIPACQHLPPSHSKLLVSAVETPGTPLLDALWSPTSICVDDYPRGPLCKPQLHDAFHCLGSTSSLYNTKEEGRWLCTKTL